MEGKGRKEMWMEGTSFLPNPPNLFLQKWEE